MNFLSTTWQTDLSKAWGFTQAGIGVASTSLAGLATVITDPTFQAAVKTVVPGPYAGLGLAMLGVMTLIAAPHPKQ